MKTPVRYLFAAVSAFSVLPVCRAAADASASPPEDKKQWRVLTAPEREHRAVMPREAERREKVEMESVGFLGVETVPVSATIAAQLGLTRGTGLVVNNIVPKSAAAGVLNEHDILLKLDDQILIETRQFSVLIRNHKENDEVTLTYLRGGQKSTAKITLGKTEVPKGSVSLSGMPLPFGAPAPGNRFEYLAAPGSEDVRADADRVLSMIQRAPAGDPIRFQFERGSGPGFRAMAMHTGNSNMVFSDDEGSLELTAKDGVKTLVAKDAKGESLFAGSVTTPQERAALPASVRARLEKLEGMHDITFRTDGNFKGETRAVRPRSISFPPIYERLSRDPFPVFY